MSTPDDRRIEAAEAAIDLVFDTYDADVDGEPMTPVLALHLHNAYLLGPSPAEQAVIDAARDCMAAVDVTNIRHQDYPERIVQRDIACYRLRAAVAALDAQSAPDEVNEVQE